MSGIKNILVASNHLKSYGGSESYTYTLIKELKKLHYNVEYFTFQKGIISQKIEELGVSFKSKTKYDLILTNHNTCVKELFRHGFIIQICHGIYPALEQPSKFSDGYISISKEIQDHLKGLGFKSKVIYNLVDKNRFNNIKPVKPELRSLLSLCHSDEANNYLKRVCSRLQIKFSSLNKYQGGNWNVEKVINENDIVVGIGRSCFESMMCGRPVVIWDNRKYFSSFGDGYFLENFEKYLKNNCSGRFTKKEFSENEFINELLKFKQEDSYKARQIAEKYFDSEINVKLILTYFHKIKRNRIKVYAFKRYWVLWILLGDFIKRNYKRLRIKNG